MEGGDEPEGLTAVERPRAVTDRQASPSRAHLRALPARPRDLEGPRYRLRHELGRGGMGEVHLARDERIGRTVALKVMLEDTAGGSELERRFLREARVQAQLEHPAIVPVHDLDWGPDGRPYFVMKRISGVTLREVIVGLRKGDRGFQGTYTTRRLLALFQQACLAIDCAHARGVIHRDIKPSNLMLGDYGEVYVLDWGIAKVIGDEDGPQSRVELARESAAGTTQHGDVLGTVGYMAPEQLVGAVDVDRRADVYSLGAVLFEILALRPLHDARDEETRERTTLDGTDARPSVRAPDHDIPLELDVICERATAVDPRERFGSARELHDAIQKFLEGDRDTRLRADMAEAHVQSARAFAQRALSEGATAADDRKTAIRHAGRALALDPSDADAAAILARLMLEPPKSIPREVVEATRAQRISEMRRGMRAAAAGFAVFITLCVAAIAPGVRSWTGLASILAPLVVGVLYAVAASYAKPQTFRFHAMALALPVAAAIAAGSGLFGPLFIGPGLALAVGGMIAVLDGLGRLRIPMLALCCASVAVPTALEWAGWIPPAYAFEGGTMTILPQIIELSEQQVRLGVGIGNPVLMVIVWAVMWRYASWVGEHRERLQLYAWHLESLAPKEVPPLPADGDKIPRSPN